MQPLESGDTHCYPTNYERALPIATSFFVWGQVTHLTLARIGHATHILVNV